MRAKTASSRVIAVLVPLALLVDGAVRVDEERDDESLEHVRAGLEP